MVDQWEDGAVATFGRLRSQRRIGGCDWLWSSGGQRLDCDLLESGVTNGDQGEKIRLELLLLRGRESCFVARWANSEGIRGKMRPRALTQSNYTEARDICVKLTLIFLNSNSTKKNNKEGETYLIPNTRSIKVKSQFGLWLHTSTF